MAKIKMWRKETHEGDPGCYHFFDNVIPETLEYKDNFVAFEFEKESLGRRVMGVSAYGFDWIIEYDVK